MSISKQIGLLHTVQYDDSELRAQLADHQAQLDILYHTRTSHWAIAEARTDGAVHTNTQTSTNISWFASSGTYDPSASFTAHLAIGRPIIPVDTLAGKYTFGANTVRVQSRDIDVTFELNTKLYNTYLDMVARKLYNIRIAGQLCTYNLPAEGATALNYDYVTGSGGGYNNHHARFSICLSSEYVLLIFNGSSCGEEDDYAMVKFDATFPESNAAQYKRG